MAEFWLPERDGVIILDRKEGRGKGRESFGSAQGGVQEKNLKVSDFIEAEHRKSL